VARGDDVRVVVQSVDLGRSIALEYAPPILRAQDIKTTVQGGEVEFRVWLDPDGPLRVADTVWVTDEATFQLQYDLVFADEVVVTDEVTATRLIERSFDDAVVMSDALSRSATFALSFADSVTMADSISAASGDTTNLSPADTVTVIDSGVLQHHDYTGEDYLLTPVDYVSAQRTF
jgi:hypothetical protein